MTIEKIDILNFKNIPETVLEFSGGVNCLLGSNGMGKSNLLEAIYFLCMTRPMSHVPESGLIRNGEEMMSVKADFLTDKGGAEGAPANREKVAIGIVKGKGKSLKRNGKEYDRLSSHIGRFPVVSVTPADGELATGAAQERRRMADMVLSQANPAYLAQLMRYNRSLESRNTLLKGGMLDPLLFESVESVMEEAAAAVHAWRKEWVEAIAPAAASIYSQIAGGGEKLEMEYTSALNDSPMKEILARNRAKDAALGYTSGGIHRDDIAASIGGFALKGYGSQGQVKSFTIALKLAIFHYLKAQGGETPLLLLDDIFDKLDSGRVGRIMRLVSQSDDFGQIFITDTNREHIDETLASLSGPKQLLAVENGTFSKVEL